MEPKSQVQFLIIPQGIVAPRTRAANASSVALAVAGADFAEDLVEGVIGALRSGRGVEHFLRKDVSR